MDLGILDLLTHSQGLGDLKSLEQKEPPLMMGLSGVVFYHLLVLSVFRRMDLLVM